MCIILAPNYILLENMTLTREVRVVIVPCQTRIAFYIKVCIIKLMIVSFMSFKLI